VLFKPPAAKMPTPASEELPQYCSLGIGLNMDLHDTGAHAWITGDLKVFEHSYVFASLLRRF